MSDSLPYPRGITAWIYLSSHGDCSNGGLSSRVKMVTVLCPEGVFEPSEEAPAVVLVRRVIGGRKYVHAEPAEPCPPNKCRMAGGAFIDTSDARFREWVDNGSYPVRLHDRHE